MSTAVGGLADGSERIRRSPGWRWSVPPVAALVFIAAAAIGPQLFRLDQPAAPRLVPVSAAKLLSEVSTAHASAFSGVIATSADMGLSVLAPAVDSIDGGELSLPSFLTEDTTELFWDSGAGQERLALPQSEGEGDLYVNRTRAWWWESASQSTTRVALDGKAPGSATTTAVGSAAPPQSIGARLVASIRSSTSISVAGSAWVAGQPAYLLALAPRPVESLVSRVELAVGASGLLRGQVLRVQVFARGQAAVALSVGYSSLTLKRPSGSLLSFRPPSGSASRRAARGSAGSRLSSPNRAGSILVDSLRQILANLASEGWLAVVSLPSTSLAHNLSAISAGAVSLSGPWGSGKVLRSSLLDVLVTSSGRIFLGAVTPSALERAAASR